MIEKLYSWTGSIIIAVIISIIFEMILPDGSTKKYVKVVSGLYILYVIINPILNLENIEQNFDLKNIIENDLEAVETFSENDVAKTYILSLENALKDSIEELGYDVNYVEFTLTSDYSEIKKIEIKMKSGSYDVGKIKECILQTYEIDSNNIVID
jgi:stage III sporulation protein AF